MTHHISQMVPAKSQTLMNGIWGTARPREKESAYLRDAFSTVGFGGG